jgi:hypothetical protein
VVKDRRTVCILLLPRNGGLGLGERSRDNASPGKEFWEANLEVFDGWGIWRILIIRRRMSGVRQREEEDDRNCSVSICQREREVWARVRTDDAMDANPLLREGGFI